MSPAVAPGARPVLPPARGLRPPGRDRVATLLLVLVFVFYGSLGRDVFFNHLADGASSDPIGAVLVYFRLFTCLLAVLWVVATAGIGPALGAVPVPFVPFLALALASCLWADLMKETFRAAVVLTALALALPLLAARVGLVRFARVTLHVIAAVLIVSALLAVLVPAVGRHTGFEALQGAHAGRWRGLFAHKNGLGPWAAFGSVLFLTHGRLLGGPRPYRWAAWACALACLAFAGSATSLVGAAALLLTCGLLRVRAWGGGLPALVLLLAGVAVAGASVLLFGEALLELLGRDATLTGRTAVWRFAWSYVETAPLLGHGYQSLGGPAFLDVEATMLSQAIPGPENMVLAGLLDLGVVGLALFFGPVLLALMRALAAIPRLADADERQAATMMIMIVVCALCMGLTESTPFICTAFDGVVCFAALFALRLVPAGRRAAAGWRAAVSAPVRPRARPIRAPQGRVGTARA